MTRSLLPAGLLAAALLLTAPDAAAQGCNISGNVTISQSTQRGNPGDTFTVSYVYGIEGGCPEFTVGHYFSTDYYFSDDDILLGTNTLPASGPQTNVSGGGTVTVPDVSRGGYSVLIVADPDDAIPEDFQSDNVNYGQFTVGGDTSGPDLNVAAADLNVAAADLEDDTAAPGDRVSIEYAILNQGNSDVGDTVIGFYLAERNTGGAPPGIIFLESEVIGNVEAGETEEDQEQVAIPNSVPPGDYALVVEADYGNAIEESNETNNDLTAGILTVIGAVTTESDAAGAALSLAAWPNPSDGALSLSYELATPSTVRLTVYDTLGRQVAVVVDRRRGTGAHAVAVDAVAWAPGTYVVRLTAGDTVATRTVTVTR